jgi:hypothetical protein
MCVSSSRLALPSGFLGAVVIMHLYVIPVLGLLSKHSAGSGYTSSKAYVWRDRYGSEVAL